jgi:hypothetical protein
MPESKDPVIFNLVVIIPGVNHTLHFKSAAAAEGFWDSIRSARADKGRGDEIIEIADDWGTRVAVKVKEIMAAQMADVGKEFESNGEIAILQAVWQVRINKKGNDHPELKQPAITPVAPAGAPRHNLRLPGR